MNEKIYKPFDITKILAFITFILITAGGIVFRLNVFNILPLLISTLVMFLQARVNRFAFLAGAFNSVLYAVAYFYMTLYSMALYALAVSFPLQIITFICWQKNTNKGVTDTRSLGAKKRAILFSAMVLLWVLLLIIFSAFCSEYLIFDNTVAILGIVSTLLGTFRYSEYAVLQVISSFISIILYAYMTVNEPEKAVWLIYSVYSASCSAIAFIRMNKGAK